MSSTNILYCHCAYAKVIPEEVKTGVLRGLIESGVEFESVPDLCEMSARHDPLLDRLSKLPELRIAACYRRAVQGLFSSAGCPLPTSGAEVINLRVTGADAALKQLLNDEVKDS